MEVAGSIPASANIFPRIGDSHCNRIHSSVTAVHCFDDVYVGKHPVAWKRVMCEVLVRRTQESMDRYTGHHDITEIMLKMALNNIQSLRSKVGFIPVVAE